MNVGSIWRATLRRGRTRQTDATERVPPLSVCPFIVLAGIVALFVAVLRGYYVPAYEGVDENACLATARRLAERGEAAKRTSDAYEYVSQNFVQVGPNLFYAKYPIGYPALCAVAYRLGGPGAAFLVNPILAVLAVVGVFLLGRAMSGDLVGALAAIVLALNPLHVFFALSARTHTGATAFAVIAMWFAWRWSERGSGWNAALTGLACAAAVSFRYSEALLVLPVGAMVVWRAMECRRTMLRQTISEVLVMIAAALVGLTPLFAYHMVAFGAPWRTGYGLCGEATGFGWEWFKANWALTLARLNTDGLFLIFPVGLAGMLALIGLSPKRGLFLAAWALPAMLVYTAYYWAPQGEGIRYARFFVSIFPALILAALAVLYPAGPSRQWTSVGVGCFVLLAVGWNLQPGELPAMLEMRRDQLLHDRAMLDWVRQELPDGSVILASDRTLNTVEYAGQYRLYSEQAFTRGWIDKNLKVLESDAPHPLQRDKALELKRTFGDMTDAELAALRRRVMREHLASGRTVAVVCTRNEAGMWRAWLGDQFEWKPLAQWIETRDLGATGPLSQPQRTTWGLYELEWRR